MCKSCKSCPINITTMEGEYADMTGCLPSFADAMKWYMETGKVWACHSNNKKACSGFIIRAKESYDIDIEVDQYTQLITEQMPISEIYGNRVAIAIWEDRLKHSDVDPFIRYKTNQPIFHHE